MSWIVITVDDVKQSLSAGELTALQTAAKAVGQADPVVETIDDVVNEMRGYIAGGKFTLGASGTIPDKLKSAALSMIRYRAANRLPVKSFMTEQRVEDNRAAITLLKSVSRGEFAIDEPDIVSTERIGGNGTQLIRTGRTVQNVDSLL